MYDGQTKYLILSSFTFQISDQVRDHSVPRGVLTLNISTIRETMIFRSGWVMGIMPYVHFSPPPSLLTNIFFKNWKYQGKNRKII